MNPSCSHMFEKPFSIKVGMYDFDKKLLRLDVWNSYWTVLSFSDFEVIAKQFYAAYKKYKYVFEKGEK